jgi:hypothetical protein
MRAIAIVLIVLGIVGLAYGGLAWTQREKVADLGPIEVTQEKHKSVPIPPVVGGICLAAGVVLLLGGRRAA